MDAIGMSSARLPPSHEPIPWENFLGALILGMGRKYRRSDLGSVFLLPLTDSLPIHLASFPPFLFFLFVAGGLQESGR